MLTHWGRVTHICIGNLTIIGSDDGLSPGRRQDIIWTNAGIVLIGTLGTNFNEILIKIDTFSFKKIHLKMSSGKWRPSCLGLNVLTHWGIDEEYMRQNCVIIGSWDSVPPVQVQVITWSNIDLLSIGSLWTNPKIFWQKFNTFLPKHCIYTECARNMPTSWVCYAYFAKCQTLMSPYAPFFFVWKCIECHLSSK